MTLMHPSSWGITARLILIATVPAFLMFAVVNISLYLSGQDEVKQALDERGQLIAAALAETSQFGVVSGHLSYLERNIRQLLVTDSSILEVVVLDAHGRHIVRAGGTPGPNATLFERPIAADVPDVNYFEGSGPHISAPAGGPTLLKPGQAVGTVQVWMSAAPIFAAKRQRLYLAALQVLAAMVLSGLAGLFLAQQLRGPLSAVMSALRQIRQGRFNVAFPRPTVGELGELQEAIVRMASDLGITQQQLEAQVRDRTHELQGALERMSQGDADRRELIARTNSMLEKERKRIAADIHDVLNASLIALRLKTQHIESLAASLMNDKAAQEIRATAATMSSSISEIYAAGRSLVKWLRPEVIDTLGLKGAVQELIRTYDGLHRDCRFSLHTSERFPNVHGEVAMTIYRLVQEALSNVVKHACASHASVALEASPDFRLLSVQVADDGQGFDTARRPEGGIGLIGMRERVSAAGGSIAISSSPGQGTVVSIELPWAGDVSPGSDATMQRSPSP